MSKVSDKVDRSKKILAAVCIFFLLGLSCNAETLDISKGIIQGRPPKIVEKTPGVFPDGYKGGISFSSITVDFRNGGIELEFSFSELSKPRILLVFKTHRNPKETLRISYNVNENCI